jgi:GT2 family glycosyltransferase
VGAGRAREPSFTVITQEFLMNPSTTAAPTATGAPPSGDRLPAGQVAIVISANRMFYPMDLCFSGFQGMLEDPRDLVLVDNGSKEREISAWGHREFTRITIIDRGADGHYCGGFNTGLRHALEHGHEFALLVNADTVVVNPKFIHELIEVARRHPRAAFFGPMVFFRDRNVIQNTILSYPTFRRTLGNWIMSHVRADSEVQSDHRVERKVDFLNGVCVLCRMSALREFGLLDEVIAAYNEDTDWNWRARRKGWYAVYSPIASIIHHQEESGYAPYDAKTFMARRNQVVWLIRANRRLEARLFRFFVLFQARQRQRGAQSDLERRRYQYYIDRFDEVSRRLLAGETPGEWFGPMLSPWVLP